MAYKGSLPIKDKETPTVAGGQVGEVESKHPAATGENVRKVSGRD